MYFCFASLPFTIYKFSYSLLNMCFSDISSLQHIAAEAQSGRRPPRRGSRGRGTRRRGVAGPQAATSPRRYQNMPFPSPVPSPVGVGQRTAVTARECTEGGVVSRHFLLVILNNTQCRHSGRQPITAVEPMTSEVGTRQACGLYEP